MSAHISSSLHTYLHPLLSKQDVYLDVCLVHAFVCLISAIITFRSLKQGLHLSECKEMEN